MHGQWSLKPTDNINQMLRIKKGVQVVEEMNTLLLVKHQYHVADDIMFPNPACLAFFTAFEEQHLHKLQEQGSIYLVAVDIFEGLMQFYIYCKDAQQSVHDCIDFLKSNSNFPVEFEIVPDASWQIYKKLEA